MWWYALLERVHAPTGLLSQVVLLFFNITFRLAHYLFHVTRLLSSSTLACSLFLLIAAEELWAR